MDTALISRGIVQSTDMGLSVIKAPRPSIPTEVVERIIDIIGELGYIVGYEKLEARTNSLHACALVARSWVPRSRLHLFRHVLLCSDRSTRRFLNSLTLSPALGQYVELLQMWPRNEDERTCGWIYKALSALAPLLPNLRKLAFCQLPDLRHECIAVLSRFRTVESLELYYLQKQSLREVVQLISRFPHLRRLHVQFCEWKLPGRCYSGKQLSLITLEVIIGLEYDRSLLEWALASKSTCALTTFRADSDVAGSALDHILQTCCSTLRELRLNLRSENDTPLLTNLLKLQRLSLHGQSKDDIPVLAHLLLCAPSSLIGIWVHTFSLTLEDSEETHKNQWKAIDLALCDSKFPHLKSVEFTGAFQKPLENPHAFFQRVLPNSYLRGLLWYRCYGKGPRTCVAPMGAPQYPGLPLEWDDSSNHPF